MNRKIVSAAILGCSLGFAVSARAALPVDGVRVQTPGQTEVLFQEFSDAAGAPEFFIGTTFLPIGFTAATVFLTEQKTGEESDALTILQNTTGGIDVFFFSDPMTIPLVDIAPLTFTVTETGKWQDVSSYFGQSAGFAQVISDVDSSTRGTIPEPSVWAMMLAGFGGVGAVLRAARSRRLRSA